MSATISTMAEHLRDKDVKRLRQSNLEDGPPKKKRRQLLELDDSSEAGTVDEEERKQPEDDIFHVNEDFARRFEHNKKREELTKLQAKYGDPVTALATNDPRNAINGTLSDPTSDSSSEDEDDDGELALGALDEQVQHTLEAIRNKDPRVYDSSVNFYTDPEEGNASSTIDRNKKQEPMYIRDYHRKNLLEGGLEAEDVDEKDLLTWQERQDDLKSSIVKELNAAIVDSASEDDRIDSTEDKFLVKKATLAPETAIDTTPAHKVTSLDVTLAEKNPEAYLSEFISTRAWVNKERTSLHPFESDDDEEEHRADAFEEAYNLRFEDPKASTEKLLSHARDTAARYSVRKDELNSRKKKRDAERSQKDAEKQLRREEKARLRKLRVAELEGKVKLIKEAAGLENENLPEQSWSELLDDAWDDEKWNSAMGQRFGDDYYNRQNFDEENDKGKLKKPKWKDEIRIDDIVVDFQDDATDTNPAYTMEEDAEVEMERDQNSKASDSNSKNERKKQKRLERRKIEQAVDGHLAIDESLAKPGKKHAGFFHYRETSPLSHGLTAHDILMADDSQLNQFAGLKKLAAFRDPDKKRKDKKHLGKKQRLRQWRKETFGNESGSTNTLADLLTGQVEAIDQSPPRRQGARRDPVRTGKKSKNP